MVPMRNEGEYTTRFPRSEWSERAMPGQRRPLVSTTSKSEPLS